MRFHALAAPRTQTPWRGLHSPNSQKDPTRPAKVSGCRESPQRVIEPPSPTQPKCLPLLISPAAISLWTETQGLPQRRGRPNPRPWSLGDHCHCQSNLERLQSQGLLEEVWAGLDWPSLLGGKKNKHPKLVPSAASARRATTRR